MSKKPKPHRNEGNLIPVHFHRIKQLWIRFFFFLKLLKIHFDLNRISLQTFFKKRDLKKNSGWKNFESN